MPSMSYCRFQNTLPDFSECVDTVHDDLSEAESRARKRLILQAAAMLESIGITINHEEVAQAITNLPSSED